MLTVIYLLLAYSVFLIANEDTLVILGKEDGVFESLTAIYFLLASMIFFVLFMKSKSGNSLRIINTNKNVFYFILFFLCLFAFGEEISWGQRILNLETPEFIKSFNMQGELNFHNLSIFHGHTADGKEKTGWEKWITMERLFKIFWFSYFVIVPILAIYSRTLYHWLIKINLPTVPISIGILFLVNYLLSRIVVALNSEHMIHPIVEIKESNLAFLFLVVSHYFLSSSADKRIANSDISDKAEKFSKNDNNLKYR